VSSLSFLGGDTGCGLTVPECRAGPLGGLGGQEGRSAGIILLWLGSGPDV
jgi:hypothetical protein